MAFSFAPQLAFLAGPLGLFQPDTNNGYKEAFRDDRNASFLREG